MIGVAIYWPYSSLGLNNVIHAALWGNCHADVKDYWKSLLESPSPICALIGAKDAS